jgi:hypothetical protein
MASRLASLGAAAAASGERTELLCALYAAARLRVVPGDASSRGRWLLPALGRLAACLPGAGPGELVAACLVLSRYYAAPGGAGGRGWLAACAAAAADASAQLSDEGVLALLGALGELGSGSSSSSGGGGSSDASDERAAAAELVALQPAAAALALALQTRLPKMPLPVLVSTTRTLERRAGAAASAPGGTPAWLTHTAEAARTALAARA